MDSEEAKTKIREKGRETAEIVGENFVGNVQFNIKNGKFINANISESVLENDNAK